MGRSRLGDLDRPLRVGVTGALGSGKTVVSKTLAGLPGVRLLDADRIGHEALRPGSRLVPELAARFGSDILDERGGVRREILARRAFRSRAGVALLNSIVHPWLVATLRRRILRLKRRRGVDIVVLDAALIFEWGMDALMDRVVVVQAPAGRRRLWLLARGLSDAQIRGRSAAQWSPARKRRRADIVVRNDGSVEDLKGRARRLGLGWLRALGRRHDAKGVES